MKLNYTKYLILIVLLSTLLYSCANIGRPDGGPRDVTPPSFVKSNPLPGTVNFNGEKVEIEFDEIVQLKDQQKKLVVSPAQKEQAVVRALGRKVTIQFRDTLLPNTTYTIDFDNCIQDNNEGNPLDGFAIAFSTGDSIDSLQVSGMVLRARDLEPMQHVLVGLHKNLDDSAFTKLPFDRISRTNDKGQFTLRNLKPGRYHLFALEDMDGDYKFARSENLAYLEEIVVPSTEMYMSSDTTFDINGRVDTVMRENHVRYLPNDLLLSMFNENYRAQYLKKNERLDARRIHILFAAPSDTLPEITILKPTNHAKDWCKLQRTAANDSLIYWLTDSALIKSDSISVALRYLRTDSLDNLTATTDTLHFVLKKSKAKKKDDSKEKDKVKEKEKLGAKPIIDENGDTIPVPVNAPSIFDSIPELNLGYRNGGLMEVGDSIRFELDMPIASIRQSGIRMEHKEDSLWVPVKEPLVLEPMDSVDVLKYKIKFSGTPGDTYKLTIDSLAVTSVYGNPNKTFRQEFKVQSLEEYANLYLAVNVADSAFVELLSSGDAIVATTPVVAGVASFENVKPGDYYARLVLDANGNGKWDTGNYADHRQPEEVYYYPKKLKLKKNWDVEQTWNIYETPVDKQKPDEIKKNKPQLRKGEKAKQRTDEEEEEEFSVPGVYTGNKYDDYRNGR